MKSLTKLGVRRITKNIYTYLSLIILVSLGVISYLGIRYTSVNMKNTLIDYLNNNNTADIIVKNNFSLDDYDFNLLNDIENIKKIEKGYSIFTKINYNNNNTENKNLINNVLSMPEEISQLELIEGKFPENSDEIVIRKTGKIKFSIGNIIEFIDINNTNKQLNKINTKKYRIVGIVNTPEIIQENNLGTSTNGLGNVDLISYIPKKNFILPDCDIFRIRLNFVNNYNFKNLKEYDRYVNDNIINIKNKISENVKNKKKEKVINDIFNEKFINTSLNMDYNSTQKYKEEIRNKIPEVKYFVQDRTYFKGYKDYLENAEKLGILSYIFSSFLLFIAVLVSSTTFTRMIEEERVVLGTLKSIGYNTFEIIKSYFIYSFSIGILGYFLGSILGIIYLSDIIYKSSYSKMYIFKNLHIYFNYIEYIILLLIILFLVSILPTLLNMIPIFKEKTVQLIRPKLDNIKKHIILEKMNFLWDKLSFNYKITLRNMFRFKKRSLMLIIGVCGCVTLILTGIGIRSSLKQTMNDQLENYYRYNIMSVYNTDIDENKIQNYKNTINSFNNEKINLTMKKLEVDILEKEKKEISTMIFDNDADISPYLGIYTLKNQNISKLPEDGIILSEKIANLCNLKEQDILKVNYNDKNYDLKIIHINKWNIEHQILMNKNYYQQIIKDDIKKNAYLINENNENNIKNIINKINKEEANMNTIDLNEITKISKESIGGLDIVIGIMVIIALILAIIIFLNLISINITERIREIATLKVLGLFSNELNNYIFREFSILTITGVILGLFTGSFLENFIIREITPENINFFKGIFLKDYILSAVLTLILLIPIYFIINRKNKKIVMMESLKSIE